MSRYGDHSFKQEILDSLYWIINNFTPEVLDQKEQLAFLQQNIMHIISGNTEKLNPFIREWGIENRGMSYQEILKELGELYQGMTEYDFRIE